jgi:hypothetical protein
MSDGYNNISINFLVDTINRMYLFEERSGTEPSMTIDVVEKAFAEPKNRDLLKTYGHHLWMIFKICPTKFFQDCLDSKKITPDALIHLYVILSTKESEWIGTIEKFFFEKYGPEYCPVLWLTASGIRVRDGHLSPTALYQYLKTGHCKGKDCEILRSWFLSLSSDDIQRISETTDLNFSDLMILYENLEKSSLVFEMENSKKSSSA